LIETNPLIWPQFMDANSLKNLNRSNGGAFVRATKVGWRHNVTATLCIGDAFVLAATASDPY
jgi:hypothetical protein